jgi:pimeloyl-ACP methyl ester carboxylesterase
MNPLWVLVHSPLVGPMTWRLVSDELRRRGEEVLVPALTDSEETVAPYWQQHADSVARALEATPAERPLILVGHSGAGPLLPAIRRRSGRPVTAYLFVDAGIPQDGASRLDLLAWESPEWTEEFRQALTEGARFPTWVEEQLREVIPDVELRRELVAELRPRALPFFKEPIPLFRGWPDAPCAYLQFSSTYAPYAEYARQQGWPVRELEAGHFHMLVEPETVTDVLVELVGETRDPRRL